MREILFRGRTFIDNEWVYGHLAISPYGEYFIIKEFRHNAKVYVYVRVDSKTVGQYTGVEDKKGNKIFEGDLITFHTEYEIDNDDVWYEEEPYIVKWNNEIAGFEPFYLNGRWRCDIVNLRIVGNKWDNPELLEEE